MINHAFLLENIESMSLLHSHTHEPKGRNDHSEKPETGVKHRSETLAYALEASATCLATDFIDPYIGHFFQKRYTCSHGGDHAHGTFAQNMIGEVAGDFISAGGLVMAEEIFPKQMHDFTQVLGDATDPLYSYLGERMLKKEKHKPDFDERLDEWKNFQKENLARAAVLAVTGVAGNIAVQKLPIVNNPSPTSVILKGKLLGAGITTALVLGMRFAYPKQMKQADEWVGEKIAPIIEGVDEMLGREDDEPHVIKHRSSRTQPAASFTERVSVEPPQQEHHR